MDFYVQIGQRSPTYKLYVYLAQIYKTPLPCAHTLCRCFAQKMGLLRQSEKRKTKKRKKKAENKSGKQKRKWKRPSRSLSLSLALSLLSSLFSLSLSLSLRYICKHGSFTLQTRRSRWRSYPGFELTTSTWLGFAAQSARAERLSFCNSTDLRSPARCSSFWAPSAPT